MSKKHPTPWKLDLNDADEPIKDANGERVLATDDGFLGPDDDTIREIVAAVNERDRLRAELADKTRNYEDVIAYHQRTEESLRDIVRRLADNIERYHLVGERDRALIRESRAAIGEDKP